MVGLVSIVGEVDKVRKREKTDAAGKKGINQSIINLIRIISA